MRTYLPLATFSLALTLNLVTVNFPSSQALASITGSQREAIPEELNQLAQYNPPSNIGAPSSTAGGGSRSGDCSENPKNTRRLITALMPDFSLGKGVVLTVSERPEFLFYLLEHEKQMAEVVLKDENEKDIYRQNLSISGKSGIISITLPQNVATLEIGKNYHWYFSVICNPRNRKKDVFVDGLIQRIQAPSTLTSQLQGATERDRVKLYAEAGIWYEAVATLAELRRKNPNDSTLADDWKRLLESAKIKDVGEVPFTFTELEKSP